MIRFIALALVLLSSHISSAQHPPEWTSASNDNYQSGSMMTSDHEGNIVLTAYRSSFLGAANIFTYKYNNLGQLIWQVEDETGVSGVYQKSRWINVDSENNVYVTGYVYAGTSSEYTTEIVVLKYGSDGSFIWKKNIANVFPSSLNLRAEMDSNDQLYIGTVSINPGFRLIKLDALGNVLFDISDATSENQNFNSMRLKGDRIAVSSYAGNGFQASVVVFDTNGNTIWSEHFESDGATDIEMDDALNVYVLSRELNLVESNSDYDIELIKFSPTGEFLNSHSFDFGSSVDFPSRMSLVNNKFTIIGAIIPQNGAYMDWVTLQCDMNGTLLWSSIYNEVISNDEKPRWVTALDNGDVFVSGQGGPGYNSLGNTYLQFVTLKYSNGIQMWSDVNPYQGYIGIVNMPDENCGVYVLGETSATLHHYTDDCTVDQVEDMSNASGLFNLTILPNPASDRTNLKVNSVRSMITDVVIYDLSGKIHGQLHRHHLAAGANNLNLELSNLNSGLYFIRVGNETTKLIIE